MYNDPFGSFNPYSGLTAQLEKQLAEIKGLSAQMAQQVRPGFDPAFTNMIRSEVELYMQQRGQQPAQQQQQNPMQLIAGAISESVSASDMEMIAGNINLVPDWLRSKDGREFVQMATESLKKYMGGSSGANQAATVATQPGAATG